MQNKQSRAAYSQKGSVFFYILIAVALFAALGFTFTRSMKGQNTKRMSTRQAELAATTLMDYAQKIARAVDRVRRNNCSETEISFEKFPFDGSDTGYFNSNSPSDFSCHVFHPDGGGLTYNSIPNEINNGIPWMLSAANQVRSIGTNNQGPHGWDSLDFIAWAPFISLETCNAINNKVGIGTPPPIDGGNADYVKYKGSFSASSGILDAANRLEGHATACFEGTGIFGSTENGGYHFYHVILAR